MLGSLGSHHWEENTLSRGFPSGQVFGFPDEKSVTSRHHTESGLCQEKQAMIGDSPQAFAYLEKKVIMAAHNGAISSGLHYYLVIVSHCSHPWLNFEEWNNLKAVIVIYHRFFLESFFYPYLFPSYLSPISTTLCCLPWLTRLKWESLNPSCYVHSQHSTRFMSQKPAERTNGGKEGQKGKQK